MRSLRTFLGATALVSAMVLTTTGTASSREKRCRVISTCSQPTTASCTPHANEPASPAQTCCQPTAASVQPKVELVAYTRPASPKRLTPQPDKLETKKTATSTACAWFMACDFGTYQIYYGIRCENNYPVPLYANALAPLPGNCDNPGGACITIGSSVIPTAFNVKTPLRNDSAIQKDVHLAHKLKAGHAFQNQVDPQATGAHKLKERSRVGEPSYIKFAGANGESVIVELQKYFVKGTGKDAKELSGTIAFGLEIDAAPAGEKVKDIDRQQIQVAADHVARATIGNVTYDIITATKLVP